MSEENKFDGLEKWKKIDRISLGPYLSAARNSGLKIEYEIISPYKAQLWKKPEIDLTDFWEEFEKLKDGGLI